MIVFWWLNSLFGCRNPCVGLECVEQTTFNSLLVFTQAQTTIATRYQDGASLTINGAVALGTEWSLLDDTSPSQIQIASNNGLVYEVPWQIGTASLEDSIWTFPTSPQSVLKSGPWYVNSYPFHNTDTIESAGRIGLTNTETDVTIHIEGTKRLQHWPAMLFSCGDLDADGISDWLATDLDDSNTGTIWLGLSTIWTSFTEDVTYDSLPSLTGALESEAFGHSVLCDVDWTEDGQIDLLIGSPFANVNGVTAAGRIQLFENTNGSFNSISSITGTREHQWIGYRLAAGDIENDGRLEVVSTGFEESNSIVQMWTWNNSWRERYTIRSSESNTFFGYDIALEDVNDDGKDDLLIGEPYYNSDKALEVGRLTIFKGTNNLLEWNNQFDTIEGTETYAHLGYQIHIRDFNQDGIQDLALPVLELD